jgi:tRNA A-37 threonylcarbamoyl transferase component Bud32
VDDPQAFDAKLRDAFEPAYELEHELTGGGMSRVFLATERALNRKVVIKVLPPELAAGVNRERFRREIQLAAQLQHPHIVPLYSAGEHGDLLYYTMPFIEGESLKHAIQEHGTTRTRFTPREVVRILHDVADALAHAHARGVIHRDIKPGNVLRSGSHAVVTDFGVAKAISASMPSTGMTRSGMAIGTPAYMAPEQLAGDPAADHRVDIYALGLLGYELLTGEAPFNEPSPQATLAAQLTREPAPVSRRRPDAPPALAALMMKCLAKQPEQRPQTAQELVSSLDAMTLGSEGPSRTAGPAARLAVLLAALVLVAVAIVLVRGARPGGSAAAPAATVAAVPAGRASAAPPALTRAESVAIASAVARRMGNRTSAAAAGATIDSAMLAAIRAEVEKAVLDSLQKLRPSAPPPGSGDRGGAGTGLRDFSRMTPAHIDSIMRSTRGPNEYNGALPGLATPENFAFPPRGSPERAAFDERLVNMGPPRRVVIADPPPNTEHPALQAAGVRVMDALRMQLGGSARYVVVNRDTTGAVLTRTRNRDSVMQLVAADMSVSLRAIPAAGTDSVRWWMTIFDPTSQLRAEVVTSEPVPASAAGAEADSLARRAVRALWQLDHSPRRNTVAAPVAPLTPAAPREAPVKKP